MQQALYDLYKLKPGSIPGVSSAHVYTRRNEWPQLPGTWEYLTFVAPPPDRFTTPDIAKRGYSLRAPSIREKRLIES